MKGWSIFWRKGYVLMIFMLLMFDMLFDVEFDVWVMFNKLLVKRLEGEKGFKGGRKEKIWGRRENRMGRD